VGCLLNNIANHIPLKLPNGAQVLVEVTPVGRTREADVADIVGAEIDQRAWDDVTQAIEGISQWVAGALERVQPTKASVEFGVEVACEPGKLTALLVKGSAKANLKITLEWSQEKPIK
jgi:hypothetical protein